ncbi:MAG: hypothetical protein ACI85K_001600 [Hyphomicrobiaceae bacterium]|jgi:hypothetical protein
MLPSNASHPRLHGQRLVRTRFANDGGSSWHKPRPKMCQPVIFPGTSIVPRPSARSSSSAMRSTSLLALTLLSLSSCYSVGVPISDVSRDQSIGKTEHELEELFGMPHESSSDSDGVEVRSYGLRHIWGWSIDSEVFIDFTLIDGIVTKTRRRFLSHAIRNKGQH